MRNSCTRIKSTVSQQRVCVSLSEWLRVNYRTATPGNKKRWRTCFLIQSIQCWVQHPEERAKKCCHSCEVALGTSKFTKVGRSEMTPDDPVLNVWFLCTCVRLCFAKCLAREIRPFKFLSIVHLLQAPTLLRRTSCSIDCYVRRTSFQFFMRS